MSASCSHQNLFFQRLLLTLLPLLTHCHLHLLQALLALLLAKEASPADGFVHLRTTNQLHLLAIHYPLGEGSLRSAVDANSTQLHHTLGQRDQVDDVAEGLALECAIQGRNHDSLALVGQQLTELHDFLKKLSLVHSDHVIPLAKSDDLHQLASLQGLLGDSG